MKKEIDAKQNNNCIAYCLSSLLHMDRVLVFDKGKIVADGTHNELLAKGGDLISTCGMVKLGGSDATRKKER
jgi:ATP-binding cassette subfamily B protein